MTAGFFVGAQWRSRRVGKCDLLAGPLAADIGADAVDRGRLGCSVANAAEVANVAAEPGRPCLRSVSSSFQQPALLFAAGFKVEADRIAPRATGQQVIAAISEAFKALGENPHHENKRIATTAIIRRATPVRTSRCGTLSFFKRIELRGLARADACRHL
jgi:hypothetical protein